MCYDYRKGNWIDGTFDSPRIRDMLVVNFVLILFSDFLTQFFEFNNQPCNEENHKGPTLYAPGENTGAVGGCEQKKLERKKYLYIYVWGKK